MIKTGKSCHSKIIYAGITYTKNYLLPTFVLRPSYSFLHVGERDSANSELRVQSPRLGAGPRRCLSLARRLARVTLFSHRRDRPKRT